MMFLAQHGIWGVCILENFLIFTEHVSRSLELHSKKTQLVLQCNYQLDCDFERCELGPKSQRLGRILFLSQPYNWCSVAEYQYNFFLLPCLTHDTHLQNSAWILVFLLAAAYRLELLISHLDIIFPVKFVEAIFSDRQKHSIEV